MNPYLAQRLAEHHMRELRTNAREPGLQARPSHRRRDPARPGPGNSVRHRAGWTLVAIGLRLAGTPDVGLSR
jgi:hypothetical protein